MNEIDVFEKLNSIEKNENDLSVIQNNTEFLAKVAAHKEWLKTINHEKPSPSKEFKVAVYIRYFNQTKYENYLDYHKKGFLDALALCPKWEFVGFYIDEGASTPRMENAKEWSRLLCDCMDGKVDLIITQRVGNVSKDMREITFCSRILAAQEPPIGIYFISEDIFTLASYYQQDLHDIEILGDAENNILIEEDNSND